MGCSQLKVLVLVRGPAVNQMTFPTQVKYSSQGKYILFSELLTILLHSAPFVARAEL